MINKIDKPMARPDEVVNLTFDLFATLGATDEQLDFPYIYSIAKQGVAIKDLNDEKKDITPLIDFIFVIRDSFFFYSSIIYMYLFSLVWYWGGLSRVLLASTHK